jgi:hypothetical protein
MARCVALVDVGAMQLPLGEQRVWLVSPCPWAGVGATLRGVLLDVVAVLAVLTGWTATGK